MRAPPGAVRCICCCCCCCCCCWGAAWSAARGMPQQVATGWTVAAGAGACGAATASLPAAFVLAPARRAVAACPRHAPRPIRRRGTPCHPPCRPADILNWIYRYFTEPRYRQWLVWISGCIQTALYAGVRAPGRAGGRGRLGWRGLRGGRGERMRMPLPFFDRLAPLRSSSPACSSPHSQTSSITTRCASRPTSGCSCRRDARPPAAAPLASPA